MIKLAGVEISEAAFEAAYAEHVAKKEKAVKPWPQDGDDDAFLLATDGGVVATFYDDGWQKDFMQGNIFRTIKEAEFERDRRTAEREKRQAKNRVLMRLKELDPESGKFVRGATNHVPMYDHAISELMSQYWMTEQNFHSNLYTQKSGVWEQIISEMPDDVKMMFS